MTRLLIAVPALFAVVALSGALGPPQAAVAQEPAASPTDSVTVTGVGTVEDTPDQAQMSFGVETRGRTAQAAIAANATALAKVIAALRQAGGRDLATQSISVWPVAREDGTIESYSASNGVSATIGVARVGALIDAAAEAGANQISGPGMSSSDADRLYRDALAKAVADARLRAEVLAKAAGRTLGEISSMSEAGSQGPIIYGKAAADSVASPTPVVPGQQETMASVNVTFDLR